ncbi:beta-ketoacyl-ACP reductase [Candidatus Roizmanbacteria bacterium CG_4_8_14_3_um_filter_35_14]|nr:MAG: beta-ketoacyl-ACP reductase [Candidatus Roizmanbacteria bacterium CG_4_8_14_3_um_filter_35_14]
MSIMQLKNKVVVITGSSSGIGQNTAIAFAKEGSKLVVNYKTNKNGAEETLRQIKKTGSQGLIFQGNVSDENTVKRLFKKTLEVFKKVDILINNAGWPTPGYLEETNKNHWLANFNDNFFTTVLCSKEAVTIMKKQGGGKIINTASIMGIDYGGREGVIAYSAAKAAVINFTKTLAKQVAPTILVNAVAPGRTQTPYYDQFDKKTIKYFIDANPIGRMINPEEITEAFLFIAKNDALVGSVVTVDGGYMLKFGKSFK